jgi:multiple sugar transport system substrate-binding protein
MYTSRGLRTHSRRSFLKGSAASVAGMAAWAAYLRQASPIAAQASGEVRLTGGAASPEEEELLRQALDAFQTEFPDITVNYEPITAQYEVKLQTDIAAGNAADVFYLPAEYAQDFMSRGVLLPIDDYMAADGVSDSDYYEGLINAYKWEGQTYGLPKDWSPLGMVYDPAALEAAGVSAPPTTWDELRSTAQALLDTNGVPGVVLDATFDRFIIFLYQAGGNVTNEDVTEVTLDDPATKEALDFYYGLYQDGLSASSADVGAQWPGDAFAQGLASIVFEGNWMFPFLNTNAPDKEYGVAELPAGAQKGAPAFTVSYSIFNGTQNPDAAWALVRYMTGPDGMATWTSLGLAMPSRPDLADQWLQEFPDREPYLTSGEYATAVQFGPGGLKFRDNANAIIQSLYAGQIDTAEAQAQLTQTAEADLTLIGEAASPSASPDGTPAS